MTHPLLKFLNLWRLGQYQKAVEELAFGPIQSLDPDKTIIELWKKLHFGSTVQLSSSGSSSNSRFYYFGPIEGIIQVENHLKKLPLVMIQMHAGPNDFYPIKNKIYSSLFAFDPSNPDFSKLWKWGEKNKGGLCASPNVWLFLSKQKDFISGIRSSEIRRISTTSWEPFFDQNLFPVHVNDNMLNVKTGDGFYTCEHKSVHCLPLKLKIGDKAANLLNMGDKNLYNDDDEITWEYKSCSCGSRLPICIQKNCHNTNKFRPKLEIAKQLEGQYKNWQAVKTDECINLFLSGEYPKSDLGIIQEHLGECRVWSGVRYRTGVNKWASFWSDKEIQDSKVEVF